MIRRRRPRRKGDKHELLRALPGALVPPLFRDRKFRKDLDPEAILQQETNDLLKVKNQFQFRLSAHVTAKAGDWTVGGWPDDPLISKLIPGLCLLGPLELKKVGEDLKPNQIDMQKVLGTVVADNFPAVEAYCRWYWAMVDHIGTLLRKYPGPALLVSKE